VVLKNNQIRHPSVDEDIVNVSSSLCSPGVSKTARVTKVRACIGEKASVRAIVHYVGRKARNNNLATLAWFAWHGLPRHYNRNATKFQKV
jgi:hypothetical protein